MKRVSDKLKPMEIVNSMILYNTDKVNSQPISSHALTSNIGRRCTLSIEELIEDFEKNYQ